MLMDWQKEAINDLRKYLSRKNSIETMNEKIEMLKVRAERFGGSSNSTPVQGGGNKPEDTLVNCIAEKIRLEENVVIAKRFVDMVERGLKYLTDDERTVLNLFYINRPTNHIERACDALHCEKSTVYRIKDSALYRFTVAMYAIVDL